MTEGWKSLSLSLSLKTSLSKSIVCSLTAGPRVRPRVKFVACDRGPDHLRLREVLLEVIDIRVDTETTGAVARQDHLGRPYGIAGSVSEGVSEGVSGI